MERSIERKTKGSRREVWKRVTREKDWEAEEGKVGRSSLVLWR